MTPNYPVPKPYKARAKRRKAPKLSMGLVPQKPKRVNLAGNPAAFNDPAASVGAGTTYGSPRGAAAGHKVYRAKKRRFTPQATGY